MRRRFNKYGTGGEVGGRSPMIPMADNRLEQMSQKNPEVFGGNLPHPDARRGVLGGVNPVRVKETPSFHEGNKKSRERMTKSAKSPGGAAGALMGGGQGGGGPQGGGPAAGGEGDAWLEKIWSSIGGSSPGYREGGEVNSPAFQLYKKTMADLKGGGIRYAEGGPVDVMDQADFTGDQAGFESWDDRTWGSEEIGSVGSDLYPDESTWPIQSSQYPGAPQSGPTSPWDTGIPVQPPVLEGDLPGLPIPYPGDVIPDYGTQPAPGGLASLDPVEARRLRRIMRAPGRPRGGRRGGRRPTPPISYGDINPPMPIYDPPIPYEDDEIVTVRPGRARGGRRGGGNTQPPLTPTYIPGTGRPRGGRRGGRGGPGRFRDQSAMDDRYGDYLASGGYAMGGPVVPGAQQVSHPMATPVAGADYSWAQPIPQNAPAYTGVQSSAHGGEVMKAKELAQYGRNGDTTLMHINTAELQGLQALLGPVTENPVTGLPEAFAWVPFLIGAAIGAVGTGAATDWDAKAMVAGGALGGLGGYLLAPAGGAGAGAGAAGVGTVAPALPAGSASILPAGTTAASLGYAPAVPGTLAAGSKVGASAILPQTLGAVGGSFAPGTAGAFSPGLTGFASTAAAKGAPSLALTQALSSTAPTVSAKAASPITTLTIAVPRMLA